MKLESNYEGDKLDSRTKIKKLVKRVKYLAYFIMAITSAGCIGWAALVSAEIEIVDIALSIGCSVFATVMVTVFLLVLIPDNTDGQSDLNDWGIIKIYDQRSDIKISSKQLPKQRLDFIAFGLSHFREENRRRELIAKRIIKGLNVRILTLNPNSIFIKEQEKIENCSDIHKEILELMQWKENILKEIEKIKKNTKKYVVKGDIQIKFYDSLPLDFFCQTDDSIYVGPYLPDNTSGKMITYQFKAQSKGGNYYSDIFEKIWSEESNIIIKDSIQAYFLMNQKKAIESVMEYFCNLFKVKGQLKVIGVVAIFKDELRRTFFSCNKTNIEHHKCYPKMNGSVGKLVELNENHGDEKSIIFSDYKNKLAFIKTQQNRNEYVQKIEHNIEKIKKDDTNAILAVPLFEKESLIGTLTFDFADLPVNYVQKISELKKINIHAELTGECKDILEELFGIANCCGKIIINLLGQNAETEYKKLYEEEWNYVETEISK